MADYDFLHALPYISLAKKQKEIEETMFSYERKSHLDYLDNLTKTGTYEEYQKELENLKALQQKLKADGVNAKVVIDQADGIYYGDIMFILDEKPILKVSIPYYAGEASSALNKHGITINPNSLYYNATMNAIMYTAVAIKANGPELYPENVRLDRNSFLMR